MKKTGYMQTVEGAIAKKSARWKAPKKFTTVQLLADGSPIPTPPGDTDAERSRALYRALLRLASLKGRGVRKVERRPARLGGVVWLLG